MIDISRLQDEVYQRDIIDMLWREHNMAIRQFCMTWLGSGLAEEVTQDVFVVAWQGLAKYRPDQSLRAWLYGIARNKCQQMYRNRARRSEIAHMFLEEIRERVHGDTPASPEVGVTASSQLQQLQASLAKLPDEDRILLNLRYWRDLPIKEIASIIGKSVPTVRKRIERAEQRLKEHMHEAAVA